jgi:transcriptional regulator with XRE-family HTH domain
MNVSPPAVTKLLNGNSNFTLKKLLEIADVLELMLKVDFEPKEAVDTSLGMKHTPKFKLYKFQDKAYSDKSEKNEFSNALDSVPHHNFDVDPKDMAA